MPPVTYPDFSLIKTKNIQIQETGDPDIVRGSYRINLPDGRTQVVNYEVQSDLIT